MRPDQASQGSHCFDFEHDFVGNWRCIPLCVRRKLDLAGIKLRLSHWLAMPEAQRQELVLWGDDADALRALATHLKQRTRDLPDGEAQDLPIASQEPWQQGGEPPVAVTAAAAALGYSLSPECWLALSELERFALCKLARPGHDHHNLAAALLEVFP